MRTARSSVLAVAAIVFAASRAFADSTPPVVTPNVAGTLGDNGWYVSDVTLTWSVSDPDSAILLTSGCDPVSITTDTFSSSFTCSATSLGGTTAVTQTIQRDTAPPVIDDTGNLGTYSVEQTVAISCNASDPLSGVASTDCIPITGAALSFPLETPVTQYFSATDNAGNSTTVPITFTVEVTYAGVAALVDVYTAKASLDRNLQRLLFNAEAAELGGNLDAKARLLDHFADRVTHNSDRNLEPGDAAVLLMLVGYL